MSLGNRRRQTSEVAKVLESHIIDNRHETQDILVSLVVKEVRERDKRVN